MLGYKSNRPTPEPFGLLISVRPGFRGMFRAKNKLARKHEETTKRSLWCHQSGGFGRPKNGLVGPLSEHPLDWHGHHAVIFQTRAVREEKSERLKIGLRWTKVGRTALGLKELRAYY